MIENNFTGERFNINSFIKKRKNFTKLPYQMKYEKIKKLKINM